MSRSGALLCLALATMLAGSSAAASSILRLPPVGYAFQPAAPCLDDPEKAFRATRPGQARYDICADQMALLVAGLDEARRGNKLLLVEIGATWCSWCTVLQRQLHDRSLVRSDFDPDAAFHIVPIGISTLHRGRMVDIPSGRAVLAELRARAFTRARTTPFIVVMAPDDPARIVARNLDDLAQSGQGRFDPARLSEVLRDAHEHVRKGSPAPSEPGWFRRKLMYWWNR